MSSYEDDLDDLLFGIVMILREMAQGHPGPAYDWLRLSELARRQLLRTRAP